jgi:hypothetical protein
MVHLFGATRHLSSAAESRITRIILCHTLIIIQFHSCNYWRRSVMRASLFRCGARSVYPPASRHEPEPDYRPARKPLGAAVRLRMAARGRLGGSIDTWGKHWPESHPGPLVPTPSHPFSLGDGHHLAPCRRPASRTVTPETTLTVSRGRIGDNTVSSTRPADTTTKRRS